MDVNKVNWIVIQKNQLIGAHGKKYYVETQKNITYSSKNSSKGTVTYQNSLKQSCWIILEMMTRLLGENLVVKLG